MCLSLLSTSHEIFKGQLLKTACGTITVKSKELLPDRSTKVKQPDLCALVDQTLHLLKHVLEQNFPIPVILGRAYFANDFG